MAVFVTSLLACCLFYSGLFGHYVIIGVTGNLGGRGYALKKKQDVVDGSAYIPQ